jgi:triphosphoribosyl-dephospho-CoA synthetase
MLLPKIAPRERIKKLRRLKAQKDRQARVQAFLDGIGNTGKRELIHEGRRLVRRHARTQIRRVLPFY